LQPAVAVVMVTEHHRLQPLLVAVVVQLLLKLMDYREPEMAETLVLDLVDSWELDVTSMELVLEVLVGLQMARLQHVVFLLADRFQPSLVEMADLTDLQADLAAEVALTEMDHLAAAAAVTQAVVVETLTTTLLGELVREPVHSIVV
tara:strand:- start:325 stop:765 length:441 start_codon:yes stop_codon:yes gene_type:complete